MRRIVMMVLRLFWKVPIYFWGIRRCGRSSKISFEESFQYVKKVTTKANHAGRVTIKAYGMENLPQEDGFVFFPNHQGLFDGLVFLESSPRPFSFIIKKEASDIILLKQVVAALKAIPIDRNNMRQSVKVIQQMTDELKEGRNFLIFAEGTRSKKGNELLPFKGGTFKSAVKAQAPIVPCALIDSFKPFDEKSIKPVTVYLYYLKPLYYNEYKDMKTLEIAAIVKRRIEEAIALHENTI